MASWGQIGAAIFEGVGTGLEKVSARYERDKKEEQRLYQQRLEDAKRFAMQDRRKYEETRSTAKGRIQTLAAQIYADGGITREQALVTAGDLFKKYGHDNTTYNKVLSQILDAQAQGAGSGLAALAAQVDVDPKNPFTLEDVIDAVTPQWAGYSAPAPPEVRKPFARTPTVLEGFERMAEDFPAALESRPRRELPDVGTSIPVVEARGSGSGSGSGSGDGSKFDAFKVWSRAHEHTAKSIANESEEKITFEGGNSPLHRVMTDPKSSRRTVMTSLMVANGLHAAQRSFAGEANREALQNALTTLEIWGATANRGQGIDLGRVNKSLQKRMTVPDKPNSRFPSSQPPTVWDVIKDVGTPNGFFTKDYAKAKDKKAWWTDMLQTGFFLDAQPAKNLAALIEQGAVGNWKAEAP